MADTKKIKLLYVILLLAVFVFGLWIRFDDVSFWKKNKELFYFNNLPIYSAYDSFHFAKLASDINQGIFKPGAPDKLRFFPDSNSEEFASKYGRWGNLISYLLAYLNKITGLPFEKLTFYLIPVLATLFVVPFFFYFKELGYPYAGLLGGIIGVSSAIYWGRTTLMRLDTDCLNLFFPFFVAYCLFKFFTTRSHFSRYLWIILASISLFFYYFWYSVNILMLFLVGAFLLFLFFNFIIKKEKPTKVELIGLFILLLPNFWYLYQAPLNLWHAFLSLVLGIKKTTSQSALFKDFPNVLQSISELQEVSVSDILGHQVCYNLIIGGLGFVGAFLFFIFNLRKGLFLLPFFGVGLLSFFSGVRFAMYLSPFIGVGLGYLFYFFIQKLFPKLGLFTSYEKQVKTIHFLGIILMFTTFLIQGKVTKSVAYPKVLSPIVKNMVFLKRNTPSDAAIWTWWDYGYAFEYYARRATFHDGGAQTTPKTYFIARSFSTSSYKEAWNITSFITNYGLKGIAEALKKGISAKELVKKVESGELSKPIKEPVYWVFTQDLFPKFGWIYYFGTYDFDKKEGTFGKFFFPKMCKGIPEGLVCEGLGKINLVSGVIDTGNGIIPIKFYYYENKGKIEKRKFFKKGIIFVWIKRPNIGNFVAVYPERVAESTFVKMFVLREYDKKYFTLVRDDFPFAVIYKVNPKPLK